MLIHKGKKERKCSICGWAIDNNRTQYGVCEEYNIVLILHYIYIYPVTMVYNVFAWVAISINSFGNYSICENDPVEGLIQLILQLDVII